ncbi:outer membrane beta-barrel protein [Geofilum rubicundum]|uniref:Outer membrane protein beta-barrel domain-containing protein n=1 Tax=Geofilum rubicundum JCM 15548 TaxID=1236989 RepID=A0A0E9LRC5_9BACT|nr:outer membrane beta-barrel protein [Geofilum rubicundum]GAO27696.1 hypothetical protein JCM15548_14541 [Geofilum rubicundum JCM 15548]
MKKLLISLTLLFLALSTFAQGNYRDVVHLNNGSIIKGIIVEQVPGQQLKIETADGSIFVYQMDEIEKMTKEPMPLSGMSTRHISKFSSPTAKGTIMISGSTNLSFASINNETKLNSDYNNASYEYDTNQFSFSPSIGWFADNGLVVALNMDYESSKVEIEEETYKESTFLIGPSITYFFGSSNIKPFILGEYMVGNYKSEDDGEHNSATVNGWGLGGGVAFFLNQHISVNLGLGYAHMTSTPNEAASAVSETISKGIAFDAGLSVYF